MKKLFVMIAGAVLLGAPMAAQAQAMGGHGMQAAGARPHDAHGYYRSERRYDRGDRDAWRDWDERDGWSGRDGLSYRGRWSDRDGWGDGDRLGGGVSVGFGADGYYPSLADDDDFRAGDYGAGYTYSYPDADGRYAPFAYRYSDADDAYYAEAGRYYDDGEGYDTAPANVGWSAGAPAPDCGRWIWRDSRRAYEWIARPCRQPS